MFPFCQPFMINTTRLHSKDVTSWAILRDVFLCVCTCLKRFYSVSWLTLGVFVSMFQVQPYICLLKFLIFVRLRGLVEMTLLMSPVEILNVSLSLCLSVFIYFIVVCQEFYVSYSWWMVWFQQYKISPFFFTVVFLNCICLILILPCFITTLLTSL